MMKHFDTLFLLGYTELAASCYGGAFLQNGVILEENLL